MANALGKCQSVADTKLKRPLRGKDPDAGKDRGQEEKGETEGETVGWYPQLNGREFEQIP